MLTGAALMVGTVLTIVGVGAVLAVFLGSGRILPGVSVMGVPLRGMTTSEAVAALSATTEVLVRDGGRTWRVPGAALGLSVDVQATALKAQRAGRGEGSLVAAFTNLAVAPVVNVDPEVARQGLTTIAETVNLPAQNATIRLINGELVPISAEAGRVLNVEVTLARLLAESGAAFDAGALDLDMTATMPTVTDATPLLAQTRALLASPLSINAHNPVTGETLAWSLPPEQWGAWLTTQNTATGIALALDSAALSGYFSDQNGALGGGQSVKVEDAVKGVQAALATGSPVSSVRLYNAQTQYTVRAGDTLGSIAWRTGVPYWMIANANPGLNVDGLSAGQTITIPSKDVMLPLPVVPHKRVVVSIPQQRMWVYENGNLKWEWAASTGIPDSPTMPGVYQITSHDGTAYAGNWNLHMPSFMSIYEAVPGFFNGIHGFPWRNGSQILWENALGTRVTYGCVLISSANAKALYAWAEDGVVVEIKG
jgi:lipoprotein-anchoring transpeptidase ErfK/SrfK